MASGRVPKTKRARTGTAGLTMTEGDAAFGQVVGGKLKGDFVAGENADTIAAETAGKVSEHEAIMLELHAEFTTGELFHHCSLNFDAVFFTHSDFYLMRLS